MALHRVYVLWTNPLFRESVHLLLNHPEVEWVGANSDYTAALANILKFKPDTILIEKTEGGLPSEVMEFLENAPWKVRLVGLSLDKNKLSIYHHEQIVVSQSDELVNMITSNSI